MLSLLPPNQSDLERGFANAVLKPDILNGIENLWSPDFCPPSFLHLLAWQLSVDTWLPEWSDNTKRTQIRLAPKIHKTKGTVKSVQEVVSAFGGGLVLREWWQQSPRGEPGTFEVFLSLPATGEPPSQTFINRVIDAISRVKPISAHFTFSLATQAFGSMGILGFSRFAVFNRLFAEFDGNQQTFFRDATGALLIDGNGDLFIEDLT